MFPSIQPTSRLRNLLQQENGEEAIGVPALEASASRVILSDDSEEEAGGDEGEVKRTQQQTKKTKRIVLSDDSEDEADKEADGKKEEGSEGEEEEKDEADGAEKEDVAYDSEENEIETPKQEFKGFMNKKGK